MNCPLRGGGRGGSCKALVEMCCQKQLSPGGGPECSKMWP